MRRSRSTGRWHVRLSSIHSVPDSYRRKETNIGRDSDVVRDVYNALARGDVGAILGAPDPKIQWREAANLLYANGNPAKLGQIGAIA